LVGIITRGLSLFAKSSRFVKHYSPYCHHCHAAAPIWQTLYEYYYTSKPVKSDKAVDSDTSLNSFHGFYNFHFASLNCITSGDRCNTNDVKAWPTFILYKDGKELSRYKGRKELEPMSQFIEETLETIKPGSRPANGVKLPEVGAKSVDTSAEPETPKAKDKDAGAGAAAGEKHNQIAEKVAEGKDAAGAEAELKDSDKEPKVIGGGQATKPVPSSIALEASPTKSRQPKKPTVTPNLAGESIPLSHESFLKLVTSTKEPWFIKFYAPWCHHCQALAPNWHQMARELEGKLNIGEVNCDVEKRLCKDVGVKGYPTIHYFRGGERVEYTGLRGLGDLVSYAKKAVDVGQGVQYVDATTFKEMEETEEVIFIYFYDHATTDEDFQALERMTLSLVGHAKLVKTDSRVLSDRFKIHTWPRLVVSRDGRPSYYNALAPKDMRDFRQVLNWMQSVWLPIVPELTASNSHEVMNGRYVVLGVLNRDRSDEFVLDKRELKNAALEWMDREVQAFQLERQELRDSKQLRIEEAEDRKDEGALRDAKHMQIHITEADRKQVGFAWVDGVFWERWIRTTYGIDIKDGERVIINDEDVSTIPPCTTRTFC
jgi:protein disulfide-isomerase